MIQGIRSVIYGVKEIKEAKLWYEKVLNKKPYFDSECYVGFNVEEFELGLYSEGLNLSIKKAMELLLIGELLRLKKNIIA